MKKITSGFTIIELLVVISIIGILAAISTTGFARYQADARDSQRSAKTNVLAEALEKYYDKNGEYPSCSALSGPADTVTTTVLPGVDTNTLLTPRSAVGDNNSIKCIDLTISGPDVFAYVGDSSPACTGGTACLSWTLKYKEEATNTVKTLTSRHNSNIAASGDTTLTATAFSANQINLSWTDVSGAVDYTLQRATDSTFTTNLVASTVTGTSSTATGLTSATLYYFRIMPNVVGTPGKWSSNASATTASASSPSEYGSLAVASSIDGYWAAAPQGFLLEDGSAVSRTTYADLFAVIGTTYGAGDGSSTFNVPDSRGRTAVNKSLDVEFDTIGERPGSKTEAITISQMPSHTHTQDAHGHGVYDPGHTHAQAPHTHDQYVSWNVAGGEGIRNDWKTDGAGGAFDQGVSTYYAYPSNYAALTNISIGGTATNQYTGSGGTHNNIQPSIVKQSAIKYAPVNPLASTLPEGTSIQGYWSSAPSGYTLENGAAVSRTNSTYSALFAAIGTTYGAGDGSTTFNLPDSQGRAGVNKSADVEFDTMGEKPGSKTEALTISQIPSHTHVQDAHTNGYDPGHTHAQAPHSHGEIVTANSGGSAIRKDYRSDGVSSHFFQGVATGSATDTNSTNTTGISVYDTTATNQSTGGGTTHNNIQPSIVKLSAIKTTSATATDQPLAVASSISGYWSSATVPSGYLPEDGAAVSRTTYAALFAEVGTTYGVGDGSTTFNTPDSRGRVAVNKKSSDTEFSTMGQKYGEKTHILTLSEMASHTHIQNAHNHSIYDPGHNHSQYGHSHSQYVTNPMAGGSSIRNDYSSDGAGASYSQGVNTAATTIYNYSSSSNITFYSATATNQYTGGGTAHNEIQPSIVKMFAIKY